MSEPSKGGQHVGPARTSRERFRDHRIAELEADNARLRKALKPIEFCAEARGDHWCPSCRGNKQEGTPTRGHYAHCPIYLALKEPDDE